MNRQLSEELGRAVSQKLWAATDGDSAQVFLMMPFRRSDAVRVSEQESKILLCHVLHERGLYHSIEAPTRMTYQQTGSTAISGRIDVTVYAGPLARERVLNVELKAGMPGIESFRKDFEKLAREGVDGLWIHTLPTAGRSTVRTLFEKMHLAIGLIEPYAIDAKHGITFVICVLDQEVALSAHLGLGPDIARAAGSLFRTNLAEWKVSGQGSEAFLGNLNTPMNVRNVSHDAVAITRRQGLRKLLIYCPQITTETLLHFSQKGDSYRLRAFAGAQAGRPPWRQPETASASEFLKSYAPELVIEVGDESVRLDNSEEWNRIVGRHNMAHGIGM